MNVEFLNINGKEVYLIGYPLKLSPTERRLLYAIADSKGKTVDELLSLLADGVSRGNVAVHINSINKKAIAVSSRRLILFQDEKYVINEFM